MVRLGRKVAAASLVLVCAAGIAYEAARLRLLQAIRGLERASSTLFARADEPAARLAAREELARIRSLLERFPGSADLQMIAAVHFRTLGLPEEAERAYLRALAIEYRPEILLNLGIVQLQAGKKDAAIETLARAVEYDPSYLELLPPSDIQGAVFERVSVNRSKQRPLLTNQHFSEEIRVPLDFPPGTVRATPARGWVAHNRGPGPMSVQRRPSTRTLDSTMLQVTTTSRLSGIMQRIETAGAGPARTRMEAWVYVLNGEVAISAAYSNVFEMSDAVGADGKWHKLTAVSRSCPVTEVRVLAASEESDFFVEEVSLMELPGRCDPMSHRVLD